jgi:GLPGLI family protein
MKLTLSAILCLLVSNLAFSQNVHFSTSGTIEYDKTINVYALIQKNIAENNDEMFKQAFEEYKKNQPQFKHLKSTLTFSKNKTLFVPIEADDDRIPFFGDHPMATQHNTIYTDLETSSFVCQKAVFEQNYLVKDSTRKITWKITNETRQIAGYTCRRANAVILDSVYVVAFYTDKIPVSGGPESFTGLPGMILGVALPHENITWFATKVTDIAVPDSKLIIPKKGKSMNDKELRATLHDALKRYDKFLSLALKGYLL